MELILVALRGFFLMCTVTLLNLRIIDSQKTLKVSFNKCRLWVFLDCTYYKEHNIICLAISAGVFLGSEGAVRN